jgi:hypothetical protein
MRYSLLLSMLYMFQAVSPPIIRSPKLYTQHEAVKLACCYRYRWQQASLTASCCVYSFGLLMMGGETA